MARRRRQKSGSKLLLELLPPLGGLLALAVFFVPGFKNLLGAFFLMVVCLLAVAAIALIGWGIWRYLKAKAEKDDQFDDRLAGKVAPVKRVMLTSAARAKWAYSE